MLSMNIEKTVRAFAKKTRMMSIAGLLIALPRYQFEDNKSSTTEGD
jgi:hypothetical protein